MKKSERFALSPEAQKLVTDGTRQWEHVDLDDGEADQKMIEGVPARRSPRYAAPVEAEVDTPDPDQIGLFDA